MQGGYSKMSQLNNTVHTMHTMKRAQCPAHGLQPCYIACSCVIKFRQPITHVIRPTKAESGVGEILCKRRDHEAHEMLLVCAVCAGENGWNKISEVR